MYICAYFEGHVHLYILTSHSHYLLTQEQHGMVQLAVPNQAQQDEVQLNAFWDVNISVGYTASIFYTLQQALAWLQRTTRRSTFPIHSQSLCFIDSDNLGKRSTYWLKYSS